MVIPLRVQGTTLGVMTLGFSDTNPRDEDTILTVATELGRSIELHGGTIGAESDGVGKGAAFTVRIPVSPLLSTSFGVSKVPATTPPRPVEGLPVGLAGLRVLVVDDESDARELVSYVLESCGAVVRQAASVAEALDMLEESSPHVVVSDIGMPYEDGYALIRAIRTLPSEEKKKTPALALTAFARSEDRTRALVEGFNMHIAKPVEPAKLVQAVIDLAGNVAKVTAPRGADSGRRLLTSWSRRDGKSGTMDLERAWRNWQTHQI